MIVSAHLGHWYSAFGFLVPAALVFGWIRLQARRERRRDAFAEHWTLTLRDGFWRLSSVEPAPLTGSRRRASAVRVGSPWPPAEEKDGLESPLHSSRSPGQVVER